MCGSNENLLETRRKILERVGYRVDVATNVEQARRLLEQTDRQYVALLACHTIPLDQQAVLQGISSSREVPVYRMEEMLIPGDLVKQVSALMRVR
jgi:DNA-binding NtrC family response regulator